MENTERPSCIISGASFRKYRLSLSQSVVYLETEANITKSLSLLEAQHEEYGQGVSNSSSFTDHISCLKFGLRSLQTFLDVSINEDLKTRIKGVVFEVMLELHSLSNRPIDGSLILDLDRAYTDLRKKVNNVIINPSTREYDVILDRSCWGLEMGYSILLRIIEDLVNAAPFMKEIEDIKENLMLLPAN